MYQSLKKSSKVPKVVKPTHKKTLLNTLGTSVINSPLSPSFLIYPGIKIEICFLSCRMVQGWWKLIDIYSREMSQIWVFSVFRSIAVLQFLFVRQIKSSCIPLLYQSNKFVAIKIIIFYSVFYGTKVLLNLTHLPLAEILFCCLNLILFFY